MLETNRNPRTTRTGNSAIAFYSNPFTADIFTSHRDNMAYRRFSLPSLKFTERPVSGGKSVQYIQRRASNALQSHEVRETSDEREHGDSREHRRNEASLLPAVDTMADLSSNFIEPTCHELESKASAVEWAAVRDGILTAVTEAAAMPVSQICLNCRNSASFHCQQCGPLGFYCEECFLKCHSTVNIFHIPCKWEVIILPFNVFCLTHTRVILYLSPKLYCLELCCSLPVHVIFVAIFSPCLDI